MRERNINWLPSTRALTGSNLQQKKYRPRLRNKPMTFPCMGWCSNQLSEPHRPGLIRLFLDLKNFHLSIKLWGLKQLYWHVSSFCFFCPISTIKYQYSQKRRKKKEMTRKWRKNEKSFGRQKAPWSDACGGISALFREQPALL